MKNTTLLLFFLLLIAGGNHIFAQTADFTADKTSSCINGIVRFTDASTDATSWEWEFGEGAIPSVATGVGPHDVFYTTTGNKSVRLTINGDKVENKPNYITVSALSVGGIITGNAASVCTGGSTGSMQLTGSTGSVEKWQKRHNGGAWTDIANTTLLHSENLAVAGIWQFRAVVKNGPCDQAFSDEVTVEVYPFPEGIATIRPEVCSGTGFNINPQEFITNGVQSSFIWAASYPAELTGGDANGSGNISQALTNLTGGVLNAVFTVTPTSLTGTCEGSDFTITVPVWPQPVGSGAIEPEVCSGILFNKNPQGNITNGVSSVFTWTASYPGGLNGGSPSGTGNISETLTNLTGGVLNAGFAVTPVSQTGSCTGADFTVTVPVRPQPVGSNETLTAICSDDAFDFDPQDNINNGVTSAFNWVASYPAGLTGGAGNGTGNISENLKNSSGSQLNAVYSITPLSSTGSCTGAVFTLTVPVRSKPEGGNSVETATCSGDEFTINPQTNITNGVSATFAWSASYPSGLSGGSPTGTDSIIQTLTNLTGEALNAVYTITPASETGSCAGSPYTITVPVRPQPVGSGSVEPEVCSGTLFNKNPQNNITNGVAGTFSWTASYPAGLNGGDANGTGMINQTLTNLTVGVLNAVYTVTPSSQAGSCPGSTFTITVPVRPQPVGISATEAELCSGTSFNKNPQGNITNGVSAVFSWTASYPAGLTGGSPNGSGNISHTLTNISGEVLNAVYTVTPVSQTGSCAGATFNITVPVRSQPAGMNSTEAEVCSGISFNKNPQDNITNGISSAFSWTASYPAGLTGGSASGPGNISQTLTNLTGDILNAVYTILPVSQTGSCTGSSYTVSVPVKPQPAGTATPASQAVCSGNALREIELINTNGVSGTVFNWVRDNTVNITGLPSGGSGNISGNPLNTTGSVQISTYTITPVSGGGCTGASYTASIQVNPNPIVDFTIKSTFNIAEDPFTLSGSPSGGVFSGPGVVSQENKFYPSVAGLGGPYLITYTYTDVNGCISSVSYPVNVQKADREILGFNSSGVHCYEEGDIPVRVEAAGLPGTFSGTGITDFGNNSAIFNTITAGAGDHLITYEYSDEGSVYKIEEVVSVDSIGIVDFVGLSPEYCVDYGFVNINALSPPGGTSIFYGPENGFFSSGKTAQLQTAVAGTGNYTITYEYISPSGCKAERSRPVTIHSLPSLTLSIRSTINILESSVDLIPFADPSGGEFTGRGVSSSESLFSPSLAGLGVAAISYTYKDVNGCISSASQDITVMQADGSIGGFAANNVVCYDAGTIAVTGTSANGLPGGSFTGTGITGTGPDAASFNPITAGAGNHTITYNYEDSHGTAFYITKTILVDSTGAVDFVGLSDGYCVTAGEVTLNAISPAGGTGLFTGPAEGLFSLGKSAFFRPYNLDPDLYDITFVYTSVNGCSSEKSRQVTVHPLPVVQLTLRETFNINESPVSLIGTGLPAGGQFSGTGVSSSDNLFSPGLAGLGTFPVVYQYTDVHSCANADTQYVSIVESQALIQGFRETGIVCYDEVPFEITGSSVNGLPGGYFTGAGVTNPQPDKGVFDPVSATAGSHTITYHYLDFAGTPFEISTVVYVDSIGSVDFINLTDGTEFCKNNPSLELIAAPLGGVFTAGSGLTGNVFSPVNATLGANSVMYTYTSQYGCSKEAVKTVYINEVPLIDFGVLDPCINVLDPDSTLFVNNTTTQNDPVVSWQWNFGNNLATESENNSTLIEPKHLYKTSGLRNVRLSAQTDKGCYETVVKQIDLGDKPRADFIWDNECFAADYAIQFSDASQSNTPVSTYNWVFYDQDQSTVLETFSAPAVEFTFPDLSYYDVSLSLTTNLGCYSSVRKTIYLRPTVKLSEGDYFEDFEDGTFGWVPEKKDGTVANSWIYGPTENTVFGTPADGVNVWYTSLTDKTKAEQSWISSPCFDFQGVTRPMIRLDVWRYFEINRDGGIIQFSKDNGVTWQNLGTIGDGINWYNSFQIAGQPGGQQVGWTAPATGLPDTEWIDARHDLDQLAGESKVRFRIAYGSNGTGLNNEGFAFNNIRISERSRLVLLEHFTNTSGEKSAPAATIVNNVAGAKPYDIAVVNYHTGFPGTDPFNLHNQADPAARALFYGVSSTPYSIMDGGLDGKGRYDFYLSDFNELDLALRSFIDPCFEMDIIQQYADEHVTAKVDITSLNQLSQKEITLHLAVVEKEIEASLVGLSGSSVFRNVLKVLLPDAGGTRLPGNWNAGQKESYSFSWYPENIFDTDKLAVVAFIQDEKTREVYQAAKSTQYGLPTGSGRLNDYGEQPKVSIFPNPASDQIFFRFDDIITSEHKLELYSLTGTLVHSDVLREGNYIYLYNTQHLKKGVYIVRIMKGRIPVVSGKIVITD